MRGVIAMHLVLVLSINAKAAILTAARVVEAPNFTDTTVHRHSSDEPLCLMSDDSLVYARCIQSRIDSITEEMLAVTQQVHQRHRSDMHDVVVARDERLRRIRGFWGSVAMKLRAFPSMSGSFAAQEEDCRRSLLITQDERMCTPLHDVDILHETLTGITCADSGNSVLAVRFTFNVTDHPAVPSFVLQEHLDVMVLARATVAVGGVDEDDVWDVVCSRDTDWWQGKRPAGNSFFSLFDVCRYRREQGSSARLQSFLRVVSELCGSALRDPFHYMENEHYEEL